MQALVQTLSSVLLYPGFLFIAAILLLVSVVHGNVGLLIRGVVGLGQRTTPLSWLGAALAGAVALALLPWPVQNISGLPRPNLWLLWSLIEIAQLLLLLPALSHADPELHRLAVREAQLTTAGRVALWLGLSVASSGALEGNFVARAVAVVAGLFALPLALDWAPFGPARPLLWAQRLPRPTHPVAALLVTLRETTLLALAACLIVVVPGLPTFYAIIAQVATIIAFTAIGRGLRGTQVEQRLGWSLRWWWNLLLPLAAIGVVLLALSI